jgi:hypothetical protein
MIRSKGSVLVLVFSLPSPARSCQIFTTPPVFSTDDPRSQHNPAQSQRRKQSTGPHSTGRPNHALGWRARGSEEVEGALDGQSLLTSGRRQARRNEGIARSNPRSPSEACWHLGEKHRTGTDGFRILCRQFYTSSLPRQAYCIKGCNVCLLRRKQLGEAILLW